MNSRQKHALRHEVRKILVEFGVIGATREIQPSERKADKGEASKQQTQDPTHPDPSEAPTSRYVRLLQIAKFFWKALVALPVAAVTLLATLLVFYPKFSFTAAAPLYPNDPFSTPFEITYDAPIPLRKAAFYCVFENVSVPSFVFRDIATNDRRASLDRMYWGDSETFYCKLPYLGPPRAILPGSSILVMLSYSPAGLGFVRRWRGVRYVSETQGDGTLRWTKHAAFWGYDLSKSPVVDVTPP